MATELSSWPVDQPAARAILQQSDTRGFIEALLGDDDIAPAWDTAASTPCDTVGQHLWLRLAERREAEGSADAPAVYQRVASKVLAERPERRTYRAAAKILKAAQRAASTAGAVNEFQEYLAELREQYRRRPSLIEVLGRAGLS